MAMQERAQRVLQPVRLGLPRVLALHQTEGVALSWWQRRQQMGRCRYSEQSRAGFWEIM